MKSFVLGLLIVFTSFGAQALEQISAEELRALASNRHHRILLYGHNTEIGVPKITLRSEYQEHHVFAHSVCIDGDTLRTVTPIWTCMEWHGPGRCRIKTEQIAQALFDRQRVQWNLTIVDTFTLKSHPKYRKNLGGALVKSVRFQVPNCQ